MIRILVLAASILAAFITQAAAGPEPYALDRGRSSVGFTYFAGSAPFKGSMPIRSAKIALDLQRLANSRVTVELDTTGTKAGFVFATQAVKGPNMLDTARFPAIRFVSDRVDGDLSGAVVRGKVTIRGVTRPLRLKARLLRRADQAKDDTSRLTVLLTGRINRHDFGASGFPDQVGEFIDLAIRARVVQAGG